MGNQERIRYVATYERDGRWCLVRIDGVGATQAKRVEDVEWMARDYIHIMTDEPADSFDVEV